MRILIFLFVILSFSCEAQATFNSLISESGAPNYFAIGVIGDSNADGAADAITSCAPGTLYLVKNDPSDWDNYTTTEITNQSVANNTSDGSIWQPFATAYKALFGRPVLLMNGAQGGSTFSNGDYDWNTASGDTLYPVWKDKVAAGLAANGVDQLDAIIINLGINDVRAGRTLANITTGSTNLLTSLESDYPGVPILMVQVGRHETSTNNADLYNIRELLVDQAQAFTNVNIVCNASIFSVQSGYEADFLHYNATTQGVMGGQMAQWFANSAYSKWTKSVLSCFYDNPSGARKTLINNFINSQVSNGNFFKLEQLLVFKTSHASNIEVDWSMITFGVTRTSTYNANSDITTDGSSTYYDCTFSPSLYTARSTVSNIISGLKIKTSTTTDNVSAFGTISTGPRVFVMGQTTSTHYRPHDATLSLGAEAEFASGNLYSIARTSTTKRLIKNKTINASATVANTGLVVAQPVSIGAVNNAGTRQQFFNGAYEYWFAAGYDTFDLDSFYDEMETLIAGW